MTGGSRRGRLVPWVPFACLAAAVVLSLLLARGGRQDAPASPQPPAEAPEPAPPPMTPAEARDFRVRIGHEECEEGASRLNELQGRERHEASPKILSELSICLRIGNLAWKKCILRASTPEDARLCNVRFLSLDHPP